MYRNKYTITRWVGIVSGPSGLTIVGPDEHEYAAIKLVESVEDELDPADIEDTSYIIEEAMSPHGQLLGSGTRIYMRKLEE